MTFRPHALSAIEADRHPAIFTMAISRDMHAQSPPRAGAGRRIFATTAQSYFDCSDFGILLRLLRHCHEMHYAGESSSRSKGRALPHLMVFLKADFSILFI